VFDRLKRVWLAFDRKWTEHDRQVDWFLNVGTALAIALTWIRDRRGWTRLADVKVPNATLFMAWLISRIKWGQIKGPLAELGKNMERSGTLLGQRMRQSDERAEQELALQQSIEQLTREGEARAQREFALQQSIERLTRRLVALTYVLGIIGVGGIAAAIWSALR
jgi:hypothetical protein